MQITTEQIKALRNDTGVSVMQCKKALEEAEGDLEKAKIILRKQSSKAASKKADRVLGAGIVATYLHAGGLIGSMVELLCETDFVSKNSEFNNLAREIAMQVAATSPEFIKQEEVDENQISKAKEVFMDEAKDKPENIREQIVQGKLDSYFNEKVLLNQPYIKNPDQKISELIEEAILKFGEKIEIGRIARFSPME